ncbi:MAG: glycosyltransferase [Candidatus Thermoplasmatota archaeon]
MDRMKLLVIPTTDWIGHPVPNRLNFIFDRLAEKHEVDVCHFKLFKKKRRDTRCNLVEMDSDTESDISGYYLKNFRKHAVEIAKISPEYDAIISTNILPSFAASLQDPPIVVDYLDHLPQSAASYYKNPLDELARRAVKGLTFFNIKKAHGLITPTTRFKEYLQKITDKEIRVIPNGLDLEKIGPVDSGEVEKKVRNPYSLGHPILGYVGSLEGWIDLENIISLMPLVKKRYPEASLLIVGPGLHTDYADHLKDLSEGLGLHDDVVFTGRVDYDELSPYISAMDVGLNPRKPLKMNTLTMGSKVLTYLACGVPVLSKNMPEAEERFKDEGVYSYSSEREFLSKLAESLTGSIDPAVVDSYGWDSLSKKYEKALTELLD